MKHVFPCPPFLLFVLCLLSRSPWNLCSNRSWPNYYYYYYYYYDANNWYDCVAASIAVQWQCFRSISHFFSALIIVLPTIISGAPLGLL